MIKVEVTEEFTLNEFNKISNLHRKLLNVEGRLFVGDRFECNKKMFDYLTGNNKQGKVVVKVIELEPEKKVGKKNGK